MLSCQVCVTLATHRVVFVSSISFWSNAVLKHLDGMNDPKNQSPPPYSVAINCPTEFPAPPSTVAPSSTSVTGTKTLHIAQIFNLNATYCVTSIIHNDLNLLLSRLWTAWILINHHSSDCWYFQDIKIHSPNRTTQTIVAGVIHFPVRNAKYISFAILLTSHIYFVGEEANNLSKEKYHKWLASSQSAISDLSSPPQPPRIFFSLLLHP